jgi:hypothetical protein
LATFQAKNKHRKQAQNSNKRALIGCFAERWASASLPNSFTSMVVVLDWEKIARAF